MGTAVSIITPSYNMLDHLKRCSRSVADQESVDFEHIVVDGASTDGTPAWLARQPHLRSISEPDEGMYDAINKGLETANCEVVAYLNCDEQYLPGTLRYVADYFEQHPDVDLLFGDFLLIRPDGTLIAYRKAYTPRRFYILASHLYLASCTMFFRRRVVEDGFRFDVRFKANGDQDFVMLLLKNGYRASFVRRYLAAFTMTGSNMSSGENARQELQRTLKAAPWWLRAFRHPLNAARLTEKFISGAYWQKTPLRYAVYGLDGAERDLHVATSASPRWKTQ